MRKRAYRHESAQVSSHWPRAMRAAGSHRRTTGSQESSLPCNCFNRTAILRSARSQYGVRALRKSPISDTPAVIAIPVPARMHGATSTRTTDAARVARRQARCLARGSIHFTRRVHRGAGLAGPRMRIRIRARSHSLRWDRAGMPRHHVPVRSTAIVEFIHAWRAIVPFTGSIVPRMRCAKADVW